MAGSVHSSYTVGSVTSGKSGAGAVASGVGGMAAAAGGAMKKTAGAGASKVAKPVSGAFKGGQRAGLGAMSKKGFKSTPKPGNDNQTPDWASKIKRQQKTRDAAHHAAHTIRSGDARGSGSSPNLRNDED